MAWVCALACATMAPSKSAETAKAFVSFRIAISVVCRTAKTNKTILGNFGTESMLRALCPRLEIANFVGCWKL
jgi:hypothetical protein